MARSLIWSTEALDDIDAIAQFIARDSPQHARKVVEALFELSDAIVEQPMLGRVMPEFGRVNVRERFPTAIGCCTRSARTASRCWPSFTVAA